MNAASSRLTTSLRPTFPGSGHWATSTAVGHSRIRRTTITRSSPPICSTAETRRVSDRFPVYALFTDPPLARAGITEREARDSGRKVLSGRRPMARVGRARERSETQGFMQVLVDDDTRKILGAALLGIEADEAIHCIIDVMNAGAPFTAIRRAVHIHPTVSELIPTLLGELQPLL